MVQLKQFNTKSAEDNDAFDNIKIDTQGKINHPKFKHRTENDRKSIDISGKEKADVNFWRMLRKPV